jgi:hypothetical protein
VVNPPSLDPDQALTDREPLQGVMIPAQTSPARVNCCRGSSTRPVH